MTLRRTLAVAFAGLVAGLVAALALTLTQLLMREWFGIAPTLDVNRFVELVNQYGYNDLKRFGIQAGLTGVLAVGTLVGIGYALVTERAASPPHWPAATTASATSSRSDERSSCAAEPSPATETS